ncbi:glycosyltransferase family 4 protein [Streptomyces sp. LZ34]
MRILTLSTAWAGHSGGVTVNRELSLALADLGHEVTARVSVPSPSHPRVHVQGLEPVLGISDERGQLLRADGLPRNIDVIVGHGRFTGGAASYLRDQFYPQAKVVHIVHALTDELDRLRDDPMQATEHANTERLLIGKADVAMGLGPLLTDDAARLARMSPTPPLVAEMPPGVILGEPPAPSRLQARLNLLLFGRADDPLKGAKLAAEAAGRLHAEGVDLQLTVLGAQPSQVRAQERALSDIARFPVKVKPFTPDRSLIEAEIRGADLVMMPSKHEGFGLVATEAAGFGVAVAVGSNTGAGMFFSNVRRVPEHLGQPSVVRVPPGSNDQQLVELWTAHIKSRLSPDSLAQTRAFALELREFLGKNYTWKHSAEAMDSTITQLTFTRDNAISATAALRLLPDSELAEMHSRLQQAEGAARRLADTQRNPGAPDLVQQLIEQHAPQEVVDRARRSAQEDQRHAKANSSTAATEAAHLRQQHEQVATEVRRRNLLTPAQRQTEEAARQQARAAQRPARPLQSAPAPTQQPSRIPGPQQRSRGSGRSL